MKIETKYSIGDEVYFMSNNKVKSGVIIGILITLGQSKLKEIYPIQSTRYSLVSQGESYQNYTDDVLYNSRNELLNNL